MEGKQLFRQYDRAYGDAFLKLLKTIHSRFSKCYLFLDKASPHYRSRKAREYFDEHKESLIPVYLPIASPKVMILEDGGISPNKIYVPKILSIICRL